jgi:hypothetical protein
MPHDRKPQATPAAAPKATAAKPSVAAKPPAVQAELRATAGLTAQQAVVKPPVPAAAVPTLRELAESITVTGGHGGAGDKAKVVDEVVKIPRGGLEALKKKGTKIVVCHDSVTDVMTELKGVKPRGWPPGMTWDSVPGLYDPAGNRVIVATRGGKVPPTGDGHGSANLVIHEVGHAIDAAGGGMSNNADFLQARAKDVAKLPAYETQAGTAGQEETFAEDMARFYSGEADHAKNYAGLDAYWKGNPLDKIGK